MSTESAIAFVVLALCAVLFVRNELVGRFQLRRIHEIHALNQREISRPDFYAVMERRYAEISRSSYVLMLLDLSRWTYRQFYPEDVS